MAHVAGWVLSALAVAGGMTPASAQSSPNCLVLGAGQWSPPDPGPIWPANTALQLADSAAAIPDSMLGHTGWREVRFADAPEPDADLRRDFDFAWGWLSPTPDSLLLVRPAMLSQGMTARGSWSADTLRGRGVTFADLVRFPMPRANVYAVRYRCASDRQRSAAFSALVRLQRADVPDEELNASDNRADSIQIMRALGDAATARDWIPVDRVFPELRATGDTLPPAARDSVLNAVMAELVRANYVRTPSVAEHTHLSPYRGFGVTDMSARHEGKWLQRVQQQYHLAGICAWHGADACPEGYESLWLAVSRPHVLDNGLISVTMFRMNINGSAWGSATTPV